jgi:hypothetical protein
VVQNQKIAEVIKALEALGINKRIAKLEQKASAVYITSGGGGGTTTSTLPVVQFLDTTATIAATTDVAIILPESGGPITYNLPASPSTGQTIIIKEGGQGLGTYTISGNGKNIDGSASTSISLPYVSITVVYNGTQWNIV